MDEAMHQSVLVDSPYRRPASFIEANSQGRIGTTKHCCDTFVDDSSQYMLQALRFSRVNEKRRLT